jgi:hypothetical protein
MLTGSGPVHIRDYYWSHATYEAVLHQAGFGPQLGFGVGKAHNGAG